VELVVDLAPGAEDNPLAEMLAGVVRSNVQHERQRREFDRLRGSVAVVADDAGTALTLRFDFGRLTVHDGLVGVPDVTIRGNIEDFETLTRLPFGSRFGVPLPARDDGDGKQALRTVFLRLRGRKLKIYGLVFHAPLVLRLLRVLGRPT
jgi:hypothetical protein